LQPTASVLTPFSKKFRLAFLLGIAATWALGAHAEVPTNGTIDTPIGKLEVVNGFPTDAAVTKLYDEMDFQRAVQAYLWALPYVAMGQWQEEQRTKFGAADLQYVDYFDYKDKLGLLTANATTPYSMAFPNLARTGPLVFEFPAGAIAGGILDFWQRPLTDTGALGPDTQKGTQGRARSAILVIHRI
jgi:hypothetical protein